MERNFKQLIGQMSLEEKAGLCSGKDFWTSKAVERLGVPSVMLTDGPHGLRKQAGASDHLGIMNSVPATCFPSAAGLACSWNVDLVKVVGEALGRECQAENVSVLLGPGANIKRSPLCGRNFEYFSEDPFLTSRLAAAHIQGVQSQGVGTSLKHFAVNNQETRRMTIDAQVDLRALHEIYLSAFEYAVKEAQPWTVMCSYNKVNGIYASEHPYLLTEILKESWGHKGFVVSDWGAVNDRIAGLKAGLELEMPGSGGLNDAKIVLAVKEGELDEAVLDDSVERILRVFFRAVDAKIENASFDYAGHHQLARRTARESAVLLKNSGNILPLSGEEKIALIGAFAEQPRYQGSGSSRINPTQLENLKQELNLLLPEGQMVGFTPGFSLEDESVDQGLIAEAVKLARQADTVVLSLGLPDALESEGYDRSHLRLPANQLALLDAVTKVNTRCIVLLSCGSAVEMPWIEQVPAVLLCYLGGQAAGGAAVDLLLGHANPSGKLAETFPKKLSDTPAHLNFPGEGDRVTYRESLFVGYRYYDAKEMEPLFAFGHGLSYTDFCFDSMVVAPERGTDRDLYTVTVMVRNTGDHAGAEVVQVYVRDDASTVARPPKELKGFAKVFLEPGESREVEIFLDFRSFAFYCTEEHRWLVESGNFTVYVGKASDQLLLSTTIRVESSAPLKQVFHRNSTFGDLLANPNAAAVAAPLLGQLGAAMGVEVRLDSMANDPMAAMIKDLPLRAMVNFSGGAFSEDMLQGLLLQLNA